MAPTTALASSLLTHLCTDLAAGTTAALDRFWHDIAERGTPVVEPTADDDHSVFVTFLWQDTGGDENVVLLSPVDDPVFEDGAWDFARCKLTRLEGSDVFYRTYRLPHDARFTYQLAPNDSLVAGSDERDWTARKRSWQHDPRNPKRFVLATSEDAPEQGSISSIVELPAAPPQPWIRRQPQVPAGQIHRHRLRSEFLDNERTVWVYTPPEFTPTADAYGLLLLFGDWASYLQAIPTPTILDNLLAAGRLPPLVALVLDVTVDRFHELTCYPPFNAFLVHELLPWARQHYHLQADPPHTTVVGCSLGGAAAAFAALSHPDSFGNVLCQDGAFWVRPGYDPATAWNLSLNEQSSAAYEPEWLAREVAQRATVPLRWYLETGRWTGPAKPYFPGNLTATRHLRDVLHAKGYQYTFSEYTGGHEFINYRGSLADGLIALLGHAV